MDLAIPKVKAALPHLFPWLSATDHPRLVEERQSQPTLMFGCSRTPLTVRLACLVLGSQTLILTLNLVSSFSG